jgi:hypothetical protein
MLAMKRFTANFIRRNTDKLKQQHQQQQKLDLAGRTDPAFVSLDKTLKGKWPICHM